MVLNEIGREIPESIQGIGRLKPYKGAFKLVPFGKKMSPKITSKKREETKIVDSLKHAIIQAGIKNGMTISFHHHLRNGDYVVAMVLDILADLGIKNLTIKFKRYRDPGPEQSNLAVFYAHVQFPDFSDPQVS